MHEIAVLAAGPFFGGAWEVSCLHEISSEEDTPSLEPPSSRHLTAAPKSFYNIFSQEMQSVKT